MAAKKTQLDIYQTAMPLDPNALDPKSPHTDGWQYAIRYIRSLGEYTPFFIALSSKKFLVSRCENCSYWKRNYVYATPRPGLICMYCGMQCKWMEIEPRGKIHSFTICRYSAEMFKDEVPFALILVEFSGVDTLFMGKLRGVNLEQPTTESPQELEGWIKSFIGRPVKAEFRKLISPKKFDPTDVWFIPDDRVI